MKRYALGVLLAAIVVAGLAGCGNRGEELLKARIGQMEKELAEARGALEEKDRELAELRAKAEQSQANIEALTAELVKVKVERDKLKQELTASLKKKR